MAGIAMDTAQLLTGQLVFSGQNPASFDVEGAAGYLDEVASEKRQQVTDLSPLLISVTLDVYKHKQPVSR